MTRFEISTPLCDLLIQRHGPQISGVDFIENARQGECRDPLLARAVEQLRQYFSNPRLKFDLPLQPRGTDFQRAVWQALLDIPVGEVTTYGELAARLGSSAQAVGNACRHNPYPLIVPCHRVVSASGLGGFAGERAGWKLVIKQQLLRHEGVEIPLQAPICL